MSSTLPADEDKSEAEIPITPNVKLADFLKEESVIDGSPLELDPNSPKLRHFSGALRPFRHSSRGLPSGSAIWCPSSLSCAGAHYSGFVGRASSMWLLGEYRGEYGILLFCSPGFWVVGFFARALSSSGG